MIHAFHLMSAAMLASVIATPNPPMSFKLEEEALTECLWARIRTLDLEQMSAEEAGRLAAARCEREARSYLDAYDLAELGELYEYTKEEVVEEFAGEASEYAALELMERRREEPSQ